jgi:hypothetical protein
MGSMSTTPRDVRSVIVSSARRARKNCSRGTVQ